MKFVFISYQHTHEFSNPEDWLNRIKAYTGILQALSKKHRVISIEQINYEGIYWSNGVAYHFVNSHNKKIIFPWQLHHHIKQLAPDVVIVHGLHLPQIIIQLRLHLGNRVKIIVQHHAEKPFTGIRKKLQQLADQFINAYLFTSYEMGLEWVRKGNLANEKKIHEVMEASSVFHPMNKPLAKAKTNVQGNPVYLWVGRLDTNKDPLTVVKAFLQFTKFHPTARLFMLYHTCELLKEIQALLQQSEIPEAIQLVGKADHCEMQYWFNSADFIIAGSHYEGSGVAVCEAMSCGCIPVLTRIPSFRKMTANGTCGILYQAGNKDELIAALVHTTNIDLVSEKEKVLLQFKKELSFDAIAEKIHEVAFSL